MRCWGFCNFSVVCRITFANHFFHFCLKSRSYAYSVRGREAAIGPGGLENTRENGATDVDF